MQSKVTDFLHSLSPLFFALLFCFIGYKIASDNIQTNLYIIGFLCVLTGLFFGEFLRMARIIKKKDKEIEILTYEVYDDPQIKKIKKLAIDALHEAQKDEMEKSKKIKLVSLVIFFTAFPILVYFFTPGLADKYFYVFSGQLIYTGQDHYFGFSPTFILDLPYLLPPIIWAIAVWFCLKIRKEIQDRKSFLNYSILTLIVLNGIFFLYSLWFLISYFIINS